MALLCTHRAFKPVHPSPRPLLPNHNTTMPCHHIPPSHHGSTNSKSQARIHLSVTFHLTKAQQETQKPNTQPVLYNFTNPPNTQSHLISPSLHFQSANSSPIQTPRALPSNQHGSNQICHAQVFCPATLNSLAAAGSPHAQSSIPHDPCNSLLHQTKKS
jgi:hypothetical protein